MIAGRISSGSFRSLVFPREILAERGFSAPVACSRDQRRGARIVGEEEADISAGLVSVSSPIAKAIIGKQPEDCVEVHTPGGIVEYEILGVRYL